MTIRESHTALIFSSADLEGPGLYLLLIGLLGGPPVGPRLLGLGPFARLALAAAADSDQRRGAQANSHNLIQPDW